VWYARIYHVENFVLGVLLVNFFDHSTWNVDDLYDDFVIEAVEIDLMELLVSAYVARYIGLLYQFKYHVFGVHLHYFFERESFTKSRNLSILIQIGLHEQVNLEEIINLFLGLRFFGLHLFKTSLQNRNFKCLSLLVILLDIKT